MGLFDPLGKEAHVKNTDTGSMSIAKILALLTPGQAWSVLAALAALVGGSFTLGQQVSNYRIEKLSDQLKTTVTTQHALEARRDFFTGYTRFLIARQLDYERLGFGDAEYSGASETAAQALADVIVPWYKPASAVPAEYEPGKSPVVTKGFKGNQDSHLKFSEGDSWPLPGVVKDFVTRAKR